MDRILKDSKGDVYKMDEQGTIKRLLPKRKESKKERRKKKPTDE